MRIEERADGAKIVVLERKDCHWCDEAGTRAKVKLKVCEKCKGTGKRGNGRCRNCNDRDGYYPRGRTPGQVEWYDHEDREPCDRCGGNPKNFDPENWTDNVDVSFLPVEVLRTGRTQGWYESHIGAGVYTVVDYGRNQTMTEEEVKEPVIKELRSVQACKVVRDKESMLLCNKIIIITGRTGYSAMPYWEEGRNNA